MYAFRHGERTERFLACIAWRLFGGMMTAADAYGLTANELTLGTTHNCNDFLLASQDGLKGAMT